jgi:glycosyltransferase involved in cell wall biosynthesis
MAERLKQKGFHFQLNMYGVGKCLADAKRLAKKLNVTDCVAFRGNVANDKLMLEMRRQDIALFTSDRNEGWGAVANESLSNGCVLVAGDTIGSTPYLIQDGINGFSFYGPSVKSGFIHPDLFALNDLCEKVQFLLNNPEKMQQMQQNAIGLMRNVWSPSVAANRLLSLITNLKENKPTPFEDGPCSKA